MIRLAAFILVGCVVCAGLIPIEFGSVSSHRPLPEARLPSAEVEPAAPEIRKLAKETPSSANDADSPEDLDYTGKTVVVIGSGATAATLIPAIAGECGHVTMLQRSPTFFRTGCNAVPIADELRELDIDEAWIHEIVRRKILHEQSVFTRRSFTEPEIVKQELLAAVRAHLGPDYDVATHFTPRYRPWRHASPLCRRRLSGGDPPRKGIGRHRRDRELHRDRHSAEIRQGSQRRHHHHGHRL